MRVYQELSPGDTLVIGNGTRVTLEHKSGRRARLRIESTEDIEHVQAAAPGPARPGNPCPPGSHSR